MKKLLLFIAFVFFLLPLCKGQFNIYYSFPHHYAYWTVDTGYGAESNCKFSSGPVNLTYNYYSDGDTLVNSKSYIKIHNSGGVYYVTTCNTVTYYHYDRFFCLLRDDTVAHKVYASFKPNLGTDTLLYDFNLKTGDYLPATPISQPSDSFYVYAVDSILIGASYRKQFVIHQYKNSVSYTYDSIIEGIGSAQGLFESIEYQDFFLLGHFLCCFNDSLANAHYVLPFCPYGCQRFYLAVPGISKPDYSISVYPNPSNGVFTIQSSVSGHPDNYRESVEVYNVLGEKVYSNSYQPTANGYQLSLSNQPNGIYLYRVITETGDLVGEGKVIVQR